MPFDPKPNPIQVFWNKIVPTCAALWTIVAFFSALFGLIEWIGGVENDEGFFGWVWQWNPRSMWSRVLDSRVDWSSRLVYLFLVLLIQIFLAFQVWVTWLWYHEDEEPITREQAEYNRERYYTDYDYHHEEHRWFSFCVAGATIWVRLAYGVGISPFPFLKG